MWSTQKQMAFSAHLPHPPPIGGAPGPPPWDILPIRLLPPGGPGGLQKHVSEEKKNGMKLS